MTAVLALRESMLFQPAADESVADFATTSDQLLVVLKKRFDSLRSEVLRRSGGSDAEAKRPGASGRQQGLRVSLSDENGSESKLLADLSSIHSARSLWEQSLSDDVRELKAVISSLSSMISDATSSCRQSRDRCQPERQQLQSSATFAPHRPDGSSSELGGTKRNRPVLSTWYTRGNAASPINSDKFSTSSSVYFKPSVKETQEVVIGRDEDDNKTINNYVIIGQLGKGSFGKVKLAEHQNSGQLFAIKIIKLSVFGKHARPGVLSKLQSEIQVMKSVAHDNIVRLHEVMHNQEAEKIYLVMDYIRNGSLAATLPNGTCPTVDPLLLRLYAKQLVQAVQALHRSNIFHRDIKPDNILLGDDGKVFLADFGVSVICSEEGVEGVEGTPAYMAPELCRAEPNVLGDRVDVWALGVTLFQLMYGVLPFRGETFIQLSRQIVNKEPDFQLVTPRGDEVPAPFITLLKGMLAKDGAQRMSIRKVRQSEWIAGEKDLPSSVNEESNPLCRLQDQSPQGSDAIVRIRPQDICETPHTKSWEEKRVKLMVTATMSQSSSIQAVESRFISGNFTSPRGLADRIASLHQKHSE